MRPMPGVPSAQAMKASASSTASSAAAPSMPTCWPITQTSQITVANIGKAISTLKRAIHAPGRGSAPPPPATGWRPGQRHAQAERGEYRQRLRGGQRDGQTPAKRP